MEVSCFYFVFIQNNIFNQPSFTDQITDVNVCITWKSLSSLLGLYVQRFLGTLYTFKYTVFKYLLKMWLTKVVEMLRIGHFLFIISIWSVETFLFYCRINKSCDLLLIPYSESKYYFILNCELVWSVHRFQHFLIFVFNVIISTT